MPSLPVHNIFNGNLLSGNTPDISILLLPKYPPGQHWKRQKRTGHSRPNRLYGILIILVFGGFAPKSLYQASAASGFQSVLFPHQVDGYQTAATANPCSPRPAGAVRLIPAVLL